MSMKSAKVSMVLGLQSGDESKGKTVDWLCSRSKNPLVVRFSSGPQCGHTVINDFGKHIHASFPSGSLAGHEGYITENCAVSPFHMKNEWDVLKGKQPNLKLRVHPLATVITPYDIAFNRTTEKINKHGSCGKGVAAAMKRNIETPYKLYAIDLSNPWALKQKLLRIHDYYFGKMKDYDAGYREYFNNELERIRGDFLDSAQWFYKFVTMNGFNPDGFDHIIFEGSQGILLDMDHGFFPHVTYANTTCKNIQWIFDWFSDITTYYVTRAYSTRHGAGPFRSQDNNFKLKNTEEETNHENQWQGKFRVGPFDPVMINYAYDIDSIYNRSQKRALCITCMDQVEKAPCLPPYYDEYYVSGTPKSEYKRIKSPVDIWS